MHELSIAQSIIETVLREKQEKHLPEVKSIVLRIGALSGVVPEALQFGYDALIIDTPLAQTELKIEHIPVQGQCKQCGREFEVQDFFFACPHCGSGDLDITHGEELDIAYLEVEETENSG